MSAPGREPCELLAWDTEFWGFPIGRVRAERLDPRVLAEIDSWSARHLIRCLYFLADANDFESTQLAEAAGFRLVDVRMTYTRALADAGLTELEAPAIRPAAAGDVPALRRLASTSYGSSRFYFDRAFPRHLCAELYATWIEQSWRGYAAAVFMAEGDANDQVDGYITCHLEPGAAGGRIGLVGVHPAARGRGVAPQLLGHACAWLRAAGATAGRDRDPGPQRGRATRLPACWLCGLGRQAVVPPLEYWST
jgi:dTDP-4-amino-4,6-dideoxy-D-galactose acyltransferase